ncbi:Pyruvate kinase [Balamuthia mandrillaris]
MKSLRGSYISSKKKLPPTMMKTKIVCTLGPASSTEEVLEGMIKGGMDVVRLNFSHGTHEEMRDLFQRVRDISAKYAEQVSIICDIQGPKIRTGKVVAPFVLAVGDIIRVTPTEVIGTPDLIQIKYATMLDDLDIGDQIFINDGIVKLTIKERVDDTFKCVVDAGGIISDHKGCNIPSGNISLNVITAKDQRDLKLIAELDPEYVAASFIGTAEDVEKVRKCLAEYGNPKIKIISKVERPVALKNLDAIIQASDAIMVARGDLGVEIPAWDVPQAQKDMVAKCNREGKPVIVATQMLESMTTSSRPTRAEANDVFNAVWDGADAVMLSGETSIGKYPVEAVKIMDKIVEAAEKRMPKRNPDDYDSSRQGKIETIGHSCFTLAKEFGEINYTGKIIIIDNDTFLTRMITKYRPFLPMLTFTQDLRTARELNLAWGIRSFYCPELSVIPSFERRAMAAIKEAAGLGMLVPEDHTIVVSQSTLIPGSGAFTGVYSVRKVLNAVDEVLASTGASSATCSTSADPQTQPK